VWLGVDCDDLFREDRTIRFDQGLDPRPDFDQVIRDAYPPDSLLSHWNRRRILIALNETSHHEYLHGEESPR